MSLPALATPAQLAAWLQTTEAELPANASAVLDMVSAIVRAEARQNFGRAQTTVTLYPADGYVTLPQRPVVSVDSVTRNGAPFADFQLRGDRLHLNGCEPVSATYTAGYLVTPGDVLAVVLTAAQRVLSNPNDLRQETVGSVSVTYAAETIGASLAPADKDLLARYRRRVAVVRTV
ncbi:hypothetical protein [Streptomyces sp. BH104]|uniref:hypothetical protein n=1 Tax=Streptomyces sp. BH104 TaxID=3410407 RepID=UPI003BB64820